MQFVSQMKMVLGRAVLKNDSSFSVTLTFDNVIGAAKVVDLYNSAADVKECPSGFNVGGLLKSLLDFGTLIYGLIKSAKK